MEKLVVTPKNKSASVFLKKLFSKLEGINDVEIVVDDELRDDEVRDDEVRDDEVRDDELLRKMKKNLKNGYTSREKVMATLTKIISQK